VIGEPNIPGRSRAFTFVELVVVIVILAVIAGMVVPRMNSWRSRQGEQSVFRVADLLSAAAKRDTYATQRSAVEFDVAAGRLKLVALRVSDVESFNPGGEVWVEDVMTPKAVLDGVKIIAGQAGIDELDVRRFHVEFPGAGGGQGRPGIALLLQDDAGQRWTVRLPSTATRAEVTTGGDPKGLSTGDPSAIDLDASGWRDEPW